MKEQIKKILLKLNLLNIIRRFSFSFSEKQKRKQSVLLDFQKRFSLNTLIETGTYLGDMVYAMRNHFQKIYSIELGKDLYDNALRRFKNERHISILHGDSSKLLPEILKNIGEPCLFWLDAHDSSGLTAKGDAVTPIIEELKVIFSHKIKNHVVLIDDASGFNGKNNYPSLETLEGIISDRNPDYVLEVRDDIVRIYPSNPYEKI